VELSLIAMSARYARIVLALLILIFVAKSSLEPPPAVDAVESLHGLNHPIVSITAGTSPLQVVTCDTMQLIVSLRGAVPGFTYRILAQELGLKGVVLQQECVLFHFAENASSRDPRVSILMRHRGAPRDRLRFAIGVWDDFHGLSWSDALVAKKDLTIGWPVATAPAIWTCAHATRDTRPMTPATSTYVAATHDALAAEGKPVSQRHEASSRDDEALGLSLQAQEQSAPDSEEAWAGSKYDSNESSGNRSAADRRQRARRSCFPRLVWPTPAAVADSVNCTGQVLRDGVTLATVASIERLPQVLSLPPSVSVSVPVSVYVCRTIGPQP